MCAELKIESDVILFHDHVCMHNHIEVATTYVVAVIIYILNSSRYL